VAQQGAVPPPESATASSAIQRLAGSLETDLKGNPARLPPYVDQFRRELGNDSRLFAFSVKSAVDAHGRVRLQGFVEFPETRHGVAALLEALGFEVVNELVTLPTPELGESRFGFITASHSFSYDHPTGQQGVVTDCLLGEPVFLLREEAGHLLVHGRDGYLGYVASKDVLRVSDADFASYLADPRVRVTVDHTSDQGLLIPAGARLKWVSTDKESATAELPTGESVTLPATKCQIASLPAARLERIIADGQRLIGTPYVWGGKTGAGIDCSGLVQSAFASAGITLPRDSNQQVLNGQLTATRWYRAGLRRGDTLYFLGEYGRVQHTAIYLGDDRYLQAEMPAVDIRSFNPQHPDYDPRRDKSFAFAKRLLD
jgi:cell wall-associated NlpC family hydrolase